MRKDILPQHNEQCLIDRFIPHYLLGNIYLSRGPWDIYMNVVKILICPFVSMHVQYLSAKLLRPMHWSTRRWLKKLLLPLILQNHWRINPTCIYQWLPDRVFCPHPYSPTKELIPGLSTTPTCFVSVKSPTSWLCQCKSNNYRHMLLNLKKMHVVFTKTICLLILSYANKKSKVSESREFNLTQN